MSINIIACIASNGAIGYQNQLIYHIAEDMRQFKALTIGHVVIMGHNTYRSLPNGALPGRTNIVLSRQDIQLPDSTVCHSLGEAIKLNADKEIYIIGGAQIYREALTIADKMYLTVVEDNPQKADAFFPAFDEDNWERVYVNVFAEKSKNITFVYLKRKNLPPKKEE